MNCEAVVTKVDVLHPQPRGFRNTKTAAVKQLGHEGIIAFEISEDSAGFRFAENDGNASGAANALNAGNEIEFAVEQLLIKKKQSAERLILGRGRYIAINREMAEEGADFFFAHLVWMTFVVEKDSPREIASQPCLQITLSPRGLEILLALCSVASIEAAFPVYQFEGRSFSCGHDEPGIMSLYAARKLVS